MSLTFWLMIVLAVSVIIIIAGTTKLKLHPFIVLLVTSYITGSLAGLPFEKLASTITTGFGNIMATIGIVIVLGTIIGTILEKSNAAIKLADLVLKVVGRKQPALAMSIIGYIVSIPVFCDSGFVILSAVKKSLAFQTRKSSLMLSIALATGLYATHTFVPPTPGPVAAAGNLGLENQLGIVIGFGLVVALVAMLVGYFWSVYCGKKFKESGSAFENLLSDPVISLPSGLKSLLPIITPIFLIAMRSVATYPAKPLGEATIFAIFSFAGQPVNALLIGFVLSLFLFPRLNQETLTGWIGEGVSASAPILLITGAGGAFGAVLKEAQIGDSIGNLLAGYELGIFLPFIIAAAFKTAQGSTTVSMVATSAIIAPLLSSLGLHSQFDTVLALMATGAGAMTFSHANDSYFWVVTQFSDLDVKTGLKTHSVATFIQGTVTMLFIYFINLIF